ncbi:M56 family metallopeptidase, partial [Escherichia marmotae]|nr:M56 family metallopeptidase [Escherichia marmotae]
LVKTPLVIGYLKPIILLPFGTIASLSPDQVEAILAHELAHIYRKDYLLNMLQALIEILFFFNPAIWWMSDYVRVERENCC